MLLSRIVFTNHKSQKKNPTTPQRKLKENGLVQSARSREKQNIFVMMLVSVINDFDIRIQQTGGEVYMLSLIFTRTHM